MKCKFVNRNGSPRLIVIYAAWGMDWRVFADLHHPSYDILAVWDYRELTFNWKPFLKYEEICLVAWSTGVFASSVTMHEIEPRVTARIAVNGTLTPIDDFTGTAPSQWRATINGLTPGSRKRYLQRMFGSREIMERFKENIPKRTIDDMKEELSALETHSIFHVEQIIDWDLAIISTDDVVIPFENQRRAWKGLAPVRILDGPHFPDFQQLIDRLIIDKTLVKSGFSKSASTYVRNAAIFSDIASTLIGHFNSVFGTGPVIGNVIEVGVGQGGLLTRQWYGRTDRRAKIKLWDITDVDTSGFAPKATFERCDAELQIRRQPDNSAGFIFSSSTVHWFNSVRDFFEECSRVLVPGGYLAVSSFIQENFEELTSITGKGLQLPSFTGWRKLIPRDMELLVCETESLTLNFDSPREILEYLRDTGATGVSFGKSPAVTARRLLERYPQDADSGLFPLTYFPVYIIARKNSD